MDQMKTGKFIAELRKQNGLTQEALGRKIGVTNKTVSRWENGNYLPDIEMLQLLAKEFHVTINELLTGERIPDDAVRQKADDTIITLAKASAFSFEERKTYYKKKWRREHIALFVLLGVIFVLAIVLPILFERPWMLGFAPIIALILYGFQNNLMMIYVEHHLYD